MHNKLPYRKVDVNLGHTYNIGLSACVVYDYIIDAVEWNMEQDHQEMMINGTWYMRTSQKKLAERCLISPRTVQRAIDTLIRKGLVSQLDVTGSLNYYTAQRPAMNPGQNDQGSDDPPRTKRRPTPDKMADPPRTKWRRSI